VKSAKKIKAAFDAAYGILDKREASQPNLVLREPTAPLDQELLRSYANGMTPYVYYEFSLP